MFDIITFGSATSDTFLRLKRENYEIFQSPDLTRGGSICFPLGSKIFIEEMQIATGGGGTNTASTFALQGLKTAFCGKVGKDRAGEAVLEDLKKFGVDIRLCQKDASQPTAFSAILSVPRTERTVLIYRGACHFMKVEDLPFKKIKQSKWFYIAPLSGDSAYIFEPLVRTAKDNKIKVAANLSNTQIKLGMEVLRPILAQVDILILNYEEASLLLGSSIREEKLMLRNLQALNDGIVVATKGEEGSMVFDGKNFFEAGVPLVKSVEKTGAGDAYAGGFVAGLLQKNEIEYAIQLATANATACIQAVGAKNGLLKKGEWGSWPKVEVVKSSV